MTAADPPRAAAAPFPARAAVVLVAALAGIYVISQFLRNSVGVIAPDLARDLSLGPAEIGLLSSLFFLVFAAAQLPLGIAIDRWGPRATILASISLAVAGAVLFAVAASFAELAAARVLMGLGCASLLMAPLTIYTRWFARDRFASMVGVQIGLGNLGTLLATVPLARTAEAVGWRPAFLAIAALTAVAAVVVALVVRDQPPGAPVERRRETLRDSVAGVLAAVRTRHAGRVFAFHCCAYSMFVTMLGLWGGPYLAHVYGYDLAARGDVLFLLAVSQVVGLLAWGTTDRLFGSYRIPVLIGSGLTGTLLLLLAAAGTLSPALLPVWFVLFGACAAFTPVMMAHGTALFPPHLTGRGMTLMNLGNMAGVFVWQAATGALMQLFPATGGVYPLIGYQVVFALMGCGLLTAAAVYATARDPRRESAKPPAQSPSGN